MARIWKYNPDPYRRTGRTTKMLRKATIRFLEGFNVVVTAHTIRYALDLQYLVEMELHRYVRMGLPIKFCPSKNLYDRK